MDNKNQVPANNGRSKDLNRFGESSKSKSAANSSGAGDPAIEKARSEINAQTSSMLREIEERRKRRLARQREMEQQIQAEEEAKARRMARIKAQEELSRSISQPGASIKKPVPTVSSSDSIFSNKNTPSEISDMFAARRSKNSDTLEHTKERATISPQEGRRAVRSVASGETQVMPKITEAVPQSTHAKHSAKAVRRAQTPVRPQSARPAGSKSAERTNAVRTDKNENKQIQKTKHTKQKKTKGEFNMLKEVRDWVIAIAVAVVLALLIRNFVFTLVQVQGHSMEPTLQENDRLYVNRLFYTPKKGDVVIFEPASDPNRPYIKRVIATEGDTVYIDFETGDVYVNDEVIDEPYINGRTTHSGSYINMLISEGAYSRDNPIVVEKDKIFVMGDNRNNSKDSREIGQVPKDELLGGAVFRFWPLNKFGSVTYKTTASYLIEDENMNFAYAAE